MQSVLHGARIVPTNTAVTFIKPRDTFEMQFMLMVKNLLGSYISVSVNFLYYSYESIKTIH